MTRRVFPHSVRRITRVVLAPDNTYTVTLHCGHELNWTTWPPVASLYCLDCARAGIQTS